MSGHCPGCGTYHEEDDDRMCSKCILNNRSVDFEKVADELSTKIGEAGDMDADSWAKFTKTLIADALRTEYAAIAAQLAEATEAVKWFVREHACSYNWPRTEDERDREWIHQEAVRALEAAKALPIVQKLMATYSPIASSKGTADGK